MRALACLPLLALTACGTIDPKAASDVLHDEGLTNVVTSDVGVFDRPCLWSEFHAVRFVAKRDGRQISGVLCATGDRGQNPILRGAFDVTQRWSLPRGSQ